MRRNVPVDYVARIRRYNTAQLVTMLQNIRVGRSPAGWAGGKAFEHLILRGFELDGAEVEWPYTVPFAGHNIEQIDGVVYFQHTTCLIEAKDYQNPLNIEPVAKLRNQLSRRPSGTLGIVFGRSSFSIPMKDLTRMMNPLQILLWDIDELEDALQTQAARLANNLPSQGMCKALQLKVRAAARLGAPDFDTRGQPYMIVTEGQSDILLLQAILNIRHDDPQITFFAAGGWSSADSYSRTRLMLDEANVAIVVNADTFNPEDAEGRRQFLHRSLGEVTLRKKYSVTVVAPEIEALWFREPCLLEQLVCRPVSEVEMMEARYEPKKVLERLLRPANLLKAYSDKLPHIDLTPLANAPEFRDLKKFLSRAKQPVPALR